MNTIGRKIYELRNEHHISQEEFSNMIGVSRQTIYQWENDLQIPKTNKLLKICDVFSIDINFFYPNSTKTNTYKKEISSDELDTTNKKISSDEFDTTNKETTLSDNKTKKLTRKQLGIIISSSIIMLILIAVSILILCLCTYEKMGVQTVHSIDFGITQNGIVIITSIAICLTTALFIFVLIKTLSKQKKNQ